MVNFIEKARKIKLPFLQTMDVCVDVGTANTRISIFNKGIVLEEPSYIGQNIKNDEYIFFGTEARTILGKTPEFVKIIRPVVNGVISDFDGEVALMKKFMQKAVEPYLHGYHFLKPTLRAVATVPHRATEIEQKALEEVFSKTGFTRTHLIDTPIASAVGCGINIYSHHPHLIVNLGAGLVELAIISGGGIVNEKTLRNAGDHMNHLISNYAYLKYGIILGESTCDELKVTLLDFKDSNKTMLVRGKSLENGLPKSVRIKSYDIKEALINNFMQILDAIKELIEMSPPEVVDEIFDRGIYLTGGLAQAPGLDGYFAQELKINCLVPEQAATTAIRGLLKIVRVEEDIVRLSNPNI